MAAETTYTPIATYTGTNTGGSVTFGSIPSTYTDLVLVMNVVRNASYAGTGIWTRLNNDSTAIYSETDLLGNGSAAISTRSSANTIWAGGQSLVNDIPFTQTYQFLNYANTTTFKTALMRFANDYNGGGNVDISMCLYRSTSAINQINIIIPGSGTFAYYSYTLYGIKAA